MTRWRRINKTICYWPSRPIGIIELIGGSYLSFKPEISYKILIEGLFLKNFAVHAWSYIPKFDHQIQAIDAWKNFRLCREKIENRVGELPQSIRIGHSLGCKLHLLAPDNGIRSQSLIALSFNNFTAKKSIPMFNKISKKLKLQTEFSPSPKETFEIITNQYKQNNNLIIGFNEDIIDQSSSLIKHLKSRGNDKSESLYLNGNHLTPVSSGIRNQLLGYSYNRSKIKSIKQIIEAIYEYKRN